MKSILEKILEIINTQFEGNSKDFATFTGISYTTLKSMLYKDAYPSFSVLNSICQKHNISADYLLGLSQFSKKNLSAKELELIDLIRSKNISDSTIDAIITILNSGNNNPD